jgi:hypothetical protein
MSQQVEISSSTVRLAAHLAGQSRGLVYLSAFSFWPYAKSFSSFFIHLFNLQFEICNLQSKQGQLFYG